MGLLGLFTKPADAAAVLIDVSSGSVAGAYVSTVKGKPTLHYDARVPIRPHEGEELEAAMLRSLAELCELLITRGVPVLKRATGHISIGEAFVSVSAPWQTSAIRVDRVEKKDAFTVTTSVMNEVIARSSKVPEGRIATGETVISTVLNGYETSTPFGRKVRRADFVVLSNSLPENVADGITAAIRKAFHARHIRFTAFAPCAFAVFRDVYPHERQFIVFDVAGAATEIALVHQGLLASVVAVPLGVGNLARPHTPRPSEAIATEKGVHLVKDAATSGTDMSRSEWMADIVTALKQLSAEYALPRTLFLVADDDAREYLRRALDDAQLRQLWLSDEPLTIAPITTSQFSPYVGIGPEAEGDVALMMLALFRAKPLDGIAP
ncbi:MAG TPA: hypothetical protein VHB93_00740 [Candidatus Paceibacterota bacterium]|nr:hypothetical protein [Candidatus Paceibacterota bacterium]